LRSKFSFFLACTVGIGLCISIAHAQSEAVKPRLKLLEANIRSLMEKSGIPGLTLAIVKGQEVIFAKGFGVRRIGEAGAVDEKTLFNVASVTKCFTADAMALLVDSGKVSWDDLVIKHLPHFELYDPYVTQNITIRDMLTMQSGLTGEEVGTESPEKTREEIVADLRKLKPLGKFRSTMGAFNQSFLVVGQVVSASSGIVWDDFVHEKIIIPLGMSSTLMRFKDLAGKENIASPHKKINGLIKPLPQANNDNYGPADSLVSSASDLAQWVILHLGNGQYKGKRLIREESMKEMHKPQAITPDWARDIFNPHSRFNTRGLPWWISEYKSLIILDGPGSYEGGSALVAFIPEKQWGVVLLANRAGFSPLVELKFEIIDLFLEGQFE
jgi:CubicO group peptidase (beta-lactamase class C family)